MDCNAVSVKLTQLQVSFWLHVQAQDAYTKASIRPDRRSDQWPYRSLLVPHPPRLFSMISNSEITTHTMHLTLHRPSVELKAPIPAYANHCNYTYGDLIFIQVCSRPTEIHCITGQGGYLPHCSVVLCKRGSQQVCVTAITLMEI